MELKHYWFIKWGFWCVLLQVVLDSLEWLGGCFLLVKSDWSFLEGMRESGLACRDVPGTIWAGLGFVSLGLLFFFTTLHSMFGVETWRVQNGVLHMRSSVLGVTIRNRHWLFSDLELPMLSEVLCDCREVGFGGFDNSWHFSRQKPLSSGWIVTVRDKTKRRSERLYWSGSKKYAEKFLAFLISAKENEQQMEREQAYELW